MPDHRWPSDTAAPMRPCHECRRQVFLPEHMVGENVAPHCADCKVRSLERRLLHVENLYKALAASLPKPG